MAVGRWRPPRCHDVESVGVAVTIFPLLGFFWARRPWAEAPSRAGLPFPVLSAEAKSGRGPVVSVGRPSDNKKLFSIYFYLGRKMLWKNVVYPFWLQKL
jgi:hypothetical protein